MDPVNLALAEVVEAMRGILILLRESQVARAQFVAAFRCGSESPNSQSPESPEFVPAGQTQAVVPPPAPAPYPPEPR